MEKYVGGETPSDRRAQGRHPQGHDRDEAVPGHLRARPSRTKASRRCSTRSSTTCRRPLDVPPIDGERSRIDDGELVQRPAKDEAPFSALVFKIMADPFVGQLAFVRIYSGSHEVGRHGLNTTKGQSERVGRLLKMHANKREEIKEVYAGDIAAAVGLKNVTTGDTISDENDPVVLESMEFPAPVIALAVEPKTKSDQEKLGERPRQADAGGPDLQGRDRPRHRPDHDLRHGRASPRDHRRPHEARVLRRGQRRQAAGRLPGDDPQGSRRPRASTSSSRAAAASSATARSSSIPAPGEGFVFENKITGGSIPKEFIKPIERASGRPCERGILAGYALVDIKIRLVRRQLPRGRLATRWRSRSRARWRSRTPSRRQTRSCSSRS